MAVTKILRNLFHIPTDHYYDDRWGIEQKATIPSAFSTTEAVFQMLGIEVQIEKSQGFETATVKKDGKEERQEIVSKGMPWDFPDFLGVTFDPKAVLVRIRQARKGRAPRRDPRDP